MSNNVTINSTQSTLTLTERMGRIADSIEGALTKMSAIQLSEAQNKINQTIADAVSSRNLLPDNPIGNLANQFIDSSKNISLTNAAGDIALAKVKDFSGKLAGFVGNLAQIGVAASIGNDSDLGKAALGVAISTLRPSRRRA